MPMGSSVLSPLIVDNQNRCFRAARVSKRYSRRHARFAFALLLPAVLAAQSQPDVRQILERLQSLEEQNKEIMTEIHALREQLSAASVRTAESPPADSHLDERVAIAEQRIQDQDQSKVESEHKFPVHLTGMLLFNAFANGRYSGG